MGPLGGDKAGENLVYPDMLQPTMSSVRTYATCQLWTSLVGVLLHMLLDELKLNLLIRNNNSITLYSEYIDNIGGDSDGIPTVKACGTVADGLASSCM